MEFIDVVTKRRSIRRYKPEPVPDDVLNQILETARIAPSAGHRQPWHFIVVKDVSIKKQLGISQWVAEAPLMLVGCVDTAIRSPPLCYVDLAIGFEHSVANMFFVPLGIFNCANVTWGQFLLNNLLPVTLGNIVGGAGLVGVLYWYLYLRD